MAFLSILSEQGSLVGVKRFAKRHRQTFNERLITEYGKSPSERAMLALEWVEQRQSSATITAVRSHGIRDDKPQDETRYDVLSLRTGTQALPRTIWQRWSIDNSWHWVHDVQL